MQKYVVESLVCCLLETFIHLLQLYNMTKDCNVSDNQYLIALTVYFFPYALLEVSTCLSATEHQCNLRNVLTVDP
jgi:hypothetical protein